MHACVQDLVRENIALNAHTIAAGGGAAAAHAFVWGQSSLSDLEDRWHAPDLVVAADVIYHRELFQPLLQALTCLGALLLPLQLLQPHPSLQSL